LHAIFYIGPSIPSVPIDIFHTTQSSTEAVISWLAPAISYTAEDYTVLYGRNQSFLNYSSETVTGNRDISSVNQMYSIPLNELLSNTTYYYQVLATNTIGTNSSEVRAFETPLPSRLFCIFKNIIISLCIDFYCSTEGVYQFI